MSATARVSWAGGTARLALTDFNRLRWTISAMRMGAPWLHRLADRGDRSVCIVDSTALQAGARTDLPEGTHVVLWDGFNSLIELHQARPALSARHDLRYLYVGALPDVESGFPSGSAALFPMEAASSGSGAAASVSRPIGVAAMAALRAWMRPFKNRRHSPSLHRRLQQGGCIVFCGLVRPQAAVLDGFFRGTGLQVLRQQLAPIVGLDWTRGEAVAQRLAVAYAHLREARLSTLADHAAAYAVLSVLHRLGTLAQLQGLTVALAVNEYGLQTHFDPYDARAYGRNLYVDFGSTRGPDLVYPRTVDLLEQRKPSCSLRLLAQRQRLADFLAANDEAAFSTACGTHARLLVQQVAELPGGGV